MAALKKINYPPLNPDLAYFCGVLAGDGYIGICKHKHEYVVNCGGNPKDEVEFYDTVIAPLAEKLFGIPVKARLLAGTYGFNIYSKNLVLYLTSEIGLPISPKTNLSIPAVFYNNPKLVLHFIRGAADTDFSFGLKKRNYPRIAGSSKSKKFMEQISEILEEHGFKVVRSFDYKMNDIRLKKGYNIINRIDLNEHTQFQKWVKLIGTRQPKNRNKIREYKKKCLEK